MNSKQLALIVLLLLFQPSIRGEGQELPRALIRSGDLIVTAGELATRGLAWPSGAHGLYPATIRERWPGGVMPVQFDPIFSEAQRQAFFSACSAWSQAAGVSCIPRTGEVEYIRVRQANRCASAVGKFVLAETVYNTIELGASCFTPGVLQHEIGHAFGLWHEHQRPDRDLYVTINWTNIPADIQYSFARTEDVPDVFPRATPLTPYDFRSVMHYTSNSAALNPAIPTIIANPGYEQFQSQLGAGHFAGLTESDKASMAALYGPPVVGRPGSPNLVLHQVAVNPITLNWSAGSGPAPTHYVIQVGTAWGASDLGIFPMGLLTSITAVAPERLRLYVRIVASNQYGTTASSETSFVVGETEPPESPRLIPTQVEVNPVTLTWVPGGGGRASGFTVYAGTAPGASNIGIFPMGAFTGISANAPPSRRLFVRVVAENAAGSATSNEISFMVGPPPPLAPVLYPADVHGATVRLSWSPSSPGVKYALHVRGVEGGQIFLAIGTGATNGLTVPGVPPGIYYVSVVATIDGLTSDESNIVPVEVRAIL